MARARAVESTQEHLLAEMQDGEDYVEEYTRNYYAKNPPQPDTWMSVDEPAFEPVSVCS